MKHPRIYLKSFNYQIGCQHFLDCLSKSLEMGGCRMYIHGTLVFVLFVENESYGL